MSHAVTITRTTTTTTSTSAVILNTGYLKTIPGLLKLTQLILGAVCCFLVGWNFSSYYTHYLGTPLLFFLIVASACLIGTFCLLVSCLFSLSTGGIISRTIYELIYHSVAFILYIIASILLLLKVKDHRLGDSNWNMIAAILGIILAVLYFISAFYARRSYRGI